MFRIGHKIKDFCFQSRLILKTQLLLEPGHAGVCNQVRVHGGNATGKHIYLFFMEFMYKISTNK